MTTAAATRLPHWDMSRIFPSLESDAFDAAFRGVVEDVKELVQLYDRHDVRRREKSEPLSDRSEEHTSELQSPC